MEEPGSASMNPLRAAALIAFNCARSIRSPFLKLNSLIEEARFKDILNKNKENVSIGKYSYGLTKRHIWGDGKLTVGKFCCIAPGVHFLRANEHAVSLPSQYPFRTLLGDKSKQDSDGFSKGPTIIGNDVWIGLNAIILSNLTIGDGAIVAAGAVVTKSVPPYALVGGVPAKVLKYRFDKRTIKELLKLKWWNWPDETVIENMDIFYTDMGSFLKEAKRISSRLK